MDKFLGWCQANRPADTYRWYKDRLNAFCQSIPPLLKLWELKPYHVQQWVDRREGLTAATPTRQLSRNASMSASSERIFPSMRRGGTRRDHLAAR